MLSEVQIKSLVLQKLLQQKKITADSLAFNELNLAGKVRRVDLAYITNKEMVAIEVKSERDSLARLSGQLSEYTKYFDRVIVVAATKFISSITLISDPAIEIWEVHQGEIKIHRRGKKLSSIKKESYLDLMTKREVSNLAKMLSIRADNLPMYEMKVEVIKKINRLSKEKVKSVLLEGLSKRFTLPSNRFLNKVLKDQRVEARDVALLSPYAFVKSI